MCVQSTSGQVTLLITISLIGHVLSSQGHGVVGSQGHMCWGLTTLLVARLDEGTELKVADPKEQQGDVEKKEAEDEERWEWVDCRGRRAGCC